MLQSAAAILFIGLAAFSGLAALVGYAEHSYEPRNSGVGMTLEEAMVKVWRQALAEHAAEVELDEQKFPVRETPRQHLREVDFVFEGEPLRGLEQNPKTESRWAQLARAGHKVMQFLSVGRYVGNVVDGKVTFYGDKRKNRS